MTQRFPIEQIMNTLRDLVKPYQVPSVTHLAIQNKEPLYILISTVLSSRTKDETTLVASERLFKKIRTCHDLCMMSEKKIADLIYPVGFYRTKAKNLIKLCQYLIDHFQGEVPRKMDSLLVLPGVGRKTANLVLSQAFGIDAICVDTHVHRITNRWGYISTKTPNETEMILRKKLPQKWWIPINTFLVSFGKNICRPISPLCSQCQINQYCQKRGVESNR